MFFYLLIRCFFIVFLTTVFVKISAFDISAQSFDDDPLMLDGGDDFGFEQLGDDGFQRGDFGSEGSQGFDPSPEQEPFDPFEQQLDSGNK